MGMGITGAMAVIHSVNFRVWDYSYSKRTVCVIWQKLMKLFSQPPSVY